MSDAATDAPSGSSGRITLALQEAAQVSQRINTLVNESYQLEHVGRAARQANGMDRMADVVAPVLEKANGDLKKVVVFFASVVNDYEGFDRHLKALKESLAEKPAKPRKAKK